jgi:hypothetical protein
MLGLSRALDAIQSKYIPGAVDPVEFHASEIRSPRNGTYWRDNNIPREVCTQILQEIGKAIANPNFSYWVKAFGIAIQQEFYNRDRAQIYERALNELCGRFDKFLETESRTNQRSPQYGILIFDESALQKETKQLMHRYRTNQHEWTQTGRVAEIPFFADSRDTRLLQAADYVAFSLFRYYEYQDMTYFNVIYQAFDSDGEIIHGLKHLHNAFNTCPCPACLTRRLSQQ